MCSTGGVCVCGVHVWVYVCVLCICRVYVCGACVVRVHGEGAW